MQINLHQYLMMKTIKKLTLSQLFYLVKQFIDEYYLASNIFLRFAKPPSNTPLMVSFAALSS